MGSAVFQMMHLQWIVIVVLGLITLGFDVKSSVPDHSPVIKPLGPEMCDRLCCQTVACSGYLYTPLGLSCRLIVGTNRSGHPSFGETYYPRDSKMDKQRFLPIHNMSCPNTSKIFYTRKKTLKCRGSQLKKVLRKHPRLLMLPYVPNLRQVYQLYLHNNSMVVRPCTHSGQPIAIAYIAAIGKFAVSTIRPIQLFTATIDNEDITVINKGTYINGISVDDKNKLLFLASERFQKDRKIYFAHINVITTEGNNFSTVTVRRGHSGQIAVDPQRQVIYFVVHRVCITKVTYKGVSRGSIVKGYIQNPLYLNSKKDVLYYAKGKQDVFVFKVFLTNCTSQTIPTSFKPFALHFYVFADNLYISSLDEGAKLFVLSDSGKEITTYNTGFNMIRNPVLLCMIT